MTKTPTTSNAPCPRVFIHAYNQPKHMMPHKHCPTLDMTLADMTHTRHPKPL